MTHPINPILEPYLQGANHVDRKHTTCNLTLRQFILGFISYSPWWLKIFYKIRLILTTLLRLKTGHPTITTITSPQDVPFTPNQLALFFTVREAQEDQYWIVEAPEDNHLAAWLAVTTDNKSHFTVTTVVKYKHWTGPIYFNLIRPFHHLVVRAMMNAACKQKY
ncbi:DUF2867 domain-containing protein [Poriferisphaera corsica]|uniref:DUF2867 domain-containing protein n=1 Tax=Poriferisphaera corsica TaxID=2528020 RepID=UPI00190AD248|nr:DUF2867 domain-containing protein [Poriferisphaera corsica]